MSGMTDLDRCEAAMKRWVDGTGDTEGDHQSADEEMVWLVRHIAAGHPNEEQINRIAALYDGQRDSWWYA